MRAAVWRLAVLATAAGIGLLLTLAAMGGA